MKRVALYLLLTLILVVTLTGCKCEHEWADATCILPQKCAKCEEVQGEPLGHTWSDATCITPKTCRVCSETEGNATGHNWMEATCISPKACCVCGDTVGDSIGHSPGEWETDEPNYVTTAVWQSKKCTVCGSTVDTNTKWLKSLHSDGWFLFSPEEFVERLDGMFPMINNCTLSAMIVVTDDDTLGCGILDGNDIVGTILFHDYDGTLMGEKKDLQGSFWGIECHFSTDDNALIARAMVGMILACDPSLEISDAVDVASSALTSAYGNSDPYFKNGLAYSYGYGSSSEQFVIVVK